MKCSGFGNSGSFTSKWITVWASTNVSWGNYDKGFFKREWIKGPNSRVCYSFWIGRFGITIHLYGKDLLR